MEAQTPWAPTRREAAQIVWGEGFIGPHEESYVLSFVNILGLKPEMSILDLRAGLGGPSRLLVERLGVWITGREISAELASEGMELAHKAGMAKKATIDHIDPVAPDLPEKKYDVAFAIDTFYRIEDKTAFLGAIAASLKPKAQISFTDLVASDEDHGEILQQWMDLEPD